MSTTIAEKKPSRGVTTANEFRQQATTIAFSLLREWVGEERAREATGRISVAVAASAAAAKDPREFYKCTPQSVATCIAIAALTGIMPSTGSSALAYLIPQPPRKDEPPLLQYMLSHRGLNALARRCGQVMIAIPISYTDEVKVDEYGMFQVISRDIDNPPTSEKELRGVLLLVREINTGLINTTAFVPKKLIEQRKAMSRSAKSQYSPWANWYVEMAMKTAMHYAISRGWCVIDDTEAVRALKMEAETDLALPGESDNVIDAPRPKGIAKLRKSLGIEQREEAETYAVTSQEPEMVPAVAKESKPTSQQQQQGSDALSEAELTLRKKLDTTTSVKGLDALRREVLGSDLATERKNALLDLLDERIAIVEEQEGN